MPSMRPRWRRRRGGRIELILVFFVAKVGDVNFGHRATW
jgi:hypothetical protein